MDGNAGGDLGLRNRYVTVGGGFGTVYLGKRDTIMKSVGYKSNLFGERYADHRQLTGSHARIEGRLNNQIAYVSPKMGGLQATIGYVIDVTSATADNDDEDAISAGAIYTNGPIYVGAAYTKYMAQSHAEEETDWRIAGSYKAGPVKIVGSYTDISDGDATAGNDYNVFVVGSAYKFGNNTIKFQYVDKDEGVTGSDDGADVWAIGFEHSMSKRTMVYADYGRLSNDSGSDIGFMSGIGNGSSTPKGGAGSEADGFGIGIIHKF